MFPVKFCVCKACAKAGKDKCADEGEDNFFAKRHNVVKCYALFAFLQGLKPVQGGRFFEAFAPDKPSVRQCAVARVGKVAVDCAGNTL